jgi:hypothetical protein
MSLRRSRRLAGLSPEVLDDVPIGNEKMGANFTVTVLGTVVMTAALVFVAFWN